MVPNRNLSWRFHPAHLCRSITHYAGKQRNARECGGTRCTVLPRLMPKWKNQ
jgi:hypothetical protein